MNTYIYMVRHGESPKLEGDERTRAFTVKKVKIFHLKDYNRERNIKGVDEFETRTN